jgi:hypothetical protein
VPASFSGEFLKLFFYHDILQHLFVEA